MSRALFLVARDEGLARSQEAPHTKNARWAAGAVQLAVFWSALVEGSRKRIRASCDREEGQRAQHRRRTHMTGARSDEANSAQAGVSCVCKFEMQKKGENQAVAGGIVSRIELMTTIAENSN